MPSSPGLVGPQADAHQDSVAKVRSLAQTMPARLSLSRRCLFVGIMVLVLGTLTEISFRLTFPMPEVRSFNRSNYMMLNYFGSQLNTARKQGVHNVLINWESEPDAFCYTHHLNLYGFRGPTFSITPPKDRPRILFVGDSYAEGCSAAEEDTIPVQFERTLDAQVQAINLGIAGVGFPEYTRLVRDSIPLLRPKEVFLVICANDLPTGCLPPKALAPAERFKRTRFYQPRLWTIARRWKKNLPIPRCFPSGPFPYFAAVPSPNNPLTWAEGLKEDLGDHHPLWKQMPPPPENIDPAILQAMRRGKFNPWLCRALPWHERLLSHDFSMGGGAQQALSLMVQRCQTAGVHLTVVYIPFHGCLGREYLQAQKRLGGKEVDQITTLADARYQRQQEHLREVTRALKVPFIDMTDTFRKAEQQGQRTFWKYDGHCTALGYRLVAEACARSWEQQRSRKRSRHVR